ncbi:prepilin peptidase [Oribacterium sp. P6A1]|uniref:prepilin peptidase n=1 Tax=Oribacterium sp. P6A1 TaxID=1410612 RepID=UPI0005658401|nr:A24 family peptidase [Oribacterium sp. P6A1]
MYHTSIGLMIYVLVIAFVLGAVFGSFIDCTAWRIVKKEKVLSGRSHCDVCNHQLGIRDLIPIVSYIGSGGKCRYCGAKISSESTWVELVLGTVFVVFVFKFDVSFVALRSMGLAVILMGLSLVDLKTYIIPDRFHAAGIAWWLLTLPLITYTKGVGIMSYLSPDFYLAAADNIPGDFTGLTFYSYLIRDFMMGFVSALSVALFMMIVSLVFDKVSGKESLGGGDIKLLFVTGLYMSTFVAFFNLILSCIVGLIFVFCLKKEKIPFGPSISVASLVSITIGSEFIVWYTGLLA